MELGCGQGDDDGLDKCSDDGNQDVLATMMSTTSRGENSNDDNGRCDVDEDYGDDVCVMVAQLVNILTGSACGDYVSSLFATK